MLSMSLPALMPCLMVLNAVVATPITVKGSIDEFLLLELIPGEPIGSAVLVFIHTGGYSITQEKNTAKKF